MKTVLIFLIAFTCYHQGNCQITKGNWLMGGNGSFLYNDFKQGGVETKTATLNLAPDIGYFFIDKFASGIRLSFYNDHIQSRQINNSNYRSFRTYSVGPFTRYYFLPVDNHYNILSEISYQFSNEKVKDNSEPTSNHNTNKFTISAGPVFYFNMSIGLEFLLNYATEGSNSSSSRSNSFGAGMGFQIHLEKDK